MAKVQEIGPYSAYAIAVKYGYKGTEEEWVKEQEANRKAAEASASAAAESAKQAAASAEQTAGAAANVDDAKNSAVKAVKNEGTVQQSAVASAGTSAVQNVKNQEAQSTSAVQSAGTTYLEQIKSAGAAQVQAVKDEGAAQTSALDDAAAAHKIELDSIASHPPQPNTETGKWQVWNAETGAYQDTDALYQGGYYTPAVSDDGVLTWQGSQAGMPSLPSANIKGPKGDKGDPGLGVPATTTSDAGKVPTVKANGSAYELAGPYAPLSAAIRPTASGNPVNITDSVEWPLLGLKVYGKSTQDGTPSPESPVPIVSAGDGGSIGLTVSNSADQSQSITVSTPNGLPGIPVDSDGNYTDASGQQWVCDEVDFARGVYVQRCNIVKSVGGDSTIKDIDTTLADTTRFTVPLTPVGKSSIDLSICSHEKYKMIWNVNETGFYVDISTAIFRLPKNLIGETAESIKAWLSMQANNRTPLQVCYQLAEPIKTPLADDNLFTYRALQTYDGTTVVSTAEDVAGIEVRYVADGEKYIDRKISEAIASAAETKLAAYDTLSGAIHEGVNEA